MTPDARALLEKLLRTRPKPDDRVLTELFMAIKSTPLQDLLAMVGGNRTIGAAATADAPVQLSPADLETYVKQRLRKVGGKAADFLPYLLDAMRQASPSASLPSTRGLTLGKALAACVQALGDEAPLAVEAALASYINENDVSYRLKSA